MIARLERYNALSKYAEPAVLVALSATIFAFAMGSSSVREAVRLGGPLRWILLFALVACAIPYGLAQVGSLPRGFVAAIASLAGVALLSASWSVTPRISAERAISFAVLMTAVVCIGAGAAVSRARVERLFLSLLVAADLIALAGLVVLLVDHQLAVQPSAPTMPARMRGFGQNPNTASMLFALAMPVAEWLAFSAQRIWVRFAAAASCALLYGSIMASGSRGAMLAAAAGTLLFVAMVAGSWRRLVPMEVVVLAFFLGTFQVSGGRPSVVPAAVQLTDRVPIVVPIGGAGGSNGSGNESSSGQRKGNGSGPAKSGNGSSSGQSNGNGSGPAKNRPPVPERPVPSTAPARSPFDVGIRQGLKKDEIPVPFVPRSSEIGQPFVYEFKPITTYGSGRVFAWLWAIRQGLEVPALGYGFGTESTVFVDRFYLFEGSYTENSFIGMFLQLGIVGVLLLLLPLLFVARAALRVLRQSRDAADRTIVAAAAGVMSGGFVVAFFQSYLYSVGNVGTLTFWVSVVLAVAAAERYVVRGVRE